MQITITKNDDGFLASCPSIEGAFAEGVSQFEAFYNLMDVINMINEYRKEKVSNRGKSSSNFEIPIAI